jgi:superfamily II DNA helicase RecQ
MLRVLRRHYGAHASFRNLQAEAISAVLAGQDVLLVFATGGGKSATFILPPLCLAEARATTAPSPSSPGCFAVVVSPLLALIREQVARLQDEMDVEAEALTGDTPEARRRAVLRDVSSDDPSVRLLYITPEQLQRPDVQDALREAYEQHGTVALFAVDEAHCVLNWGRDFRPAYLQLRQALREAFPKVPMLAATATATAEDRRAIAAALGLRVFGSAGGGGGGGGVGGAGGGSGIVLCSTANRPNLRYRVRFKELLVLGGGGGFYRDEEGRHEEGDDEEEDDSDDAPDDPAASPPSPASLDRRAAAAATRDLLRYVRRRALNTTPPQAGIVYARTRDRVDALAAALCNAGVDAAAFHAGKDSHARARVSEQWSRGELNVVVSTVAFGMGIDRADVRFVCHSDPPSSVEGYSQEAGRAGRDGLPAENVVWASHADFETVAALQRRGGGGGGSRPAIAAVADMLGTAGCLRRRLLAHFGERRAGGCGEGEEACDYCCVAAEGGGGGGGGAAPAAAGAAKQRPATIVRGAEARRAVARWQEIGAERAARAAAAGRPRERGGEEEEEGAAAAAASDDDGSGEADKENSSAAPKALARPGWGRASTYTGKRRAPPLAKPAAAAPPARAAAAAAEPPPPPPPPPPPVLPASPRQQQRDIAAARSRALAAARAVAAPVGPAPAAAPRVPLRRAFVPPLRRPPPPAAPQQE